MVCQLSSYNECALHVPSVQLAVWLSGPVHDLVGQLLAWLAVLLGSLKLTNGGRPETPVSHPVQHDWRLIGSESLRGGCSTTRLGWTFPRGGCSEGAASLVRATSQREPHVISTTRHVSLSDYFKKFVANNV